MAVSLCSQCQSPRAEGGLLGQCPRCLGALAFGPSEPLAGEILHQAGDYDVLHELGRGGMGVVYEARQRSLNRRVAVKMLLAGAWARPEFAPRFRAEAESVARLRHPGIVTIHEIGELEGQPFFAMELMAGPSLSELVRTQPLPPKRAARYVRLVAEAIAHAHAAGVLHRDLKPSNVLLDESDQPRVTDFGLAKQLDSNAELTRTGELVGSPNYLPPEQVSGGQVTAAGDIYSLGAILYQLLTARPPFVADTVAATLHQVLHSEPVAPRLLNAAVPRDLETIGLKCLHKEPSRRYASAAELAADLARFEAGEPVWARPVSQGERAVLWCRRKPALAAVSTALGLAVVVGLSSVLGQWRRAEASQEEMARNLYAADVAAASTARLEGNLGRARELLLRHAPTTVGIQSAEGVRAAAAARTEFTWRLLWARCQSDELATLGTHPWIVTCVAVSPDGQWVASGSQDQPTNVTNSLKLWHLGGAAPAGVATHTLAASNTIWSVAFTDDSRTLISAGSKGVHFWDVATGAARTDFPALAGQEVTRAGEVLVGSPNHAFLNPSTLQPLWRMNLATHEVRPLPLRGRHPALSPDGQRLALLDAAQNIQLFDLATEQLLFTVASNQPIFRLRFSPDGRRLVGSGQTTSARVWNLSRPGEAPVTFTSRHNVWDAVFTPDGATLITATSHQQIELWEAATGHHRGRLAGHNNEVWSVAPTPDGRRFVSGGKDRTVRLWSPAPPPAVSAVPQWRHVQPMFSPDSTRLLTYMQTNWHGATTVWEQRTAKRGTRTEIQAVGTLGGFPRGFAPDGTNLLFLRVDHPTLEWWQLQPARVVRTIRLENAPTNVFAAEFALAGDARSFACPDETGTFWQWSTEDGRLLRRWTDGEVTARIRAEFTGGNRPHRLFRSFIASHSGRWLALGPNGTCTGVLVDLEQGTAVRLRGHHDDLASLAFTRDERLLATGSGDGTIRLWQVADGQPAGELPGHLESVEAVAFSPDGQTLASMNYGVEVTFWHLPTRRELARFPYSIAGAQLAFSPDGRHLALNVTIPGARGEPEREAVELWDAPTSQAESH